MLLIYLLFLFIIIFFICYKILSFINIKLYISSFTLSIIMAMVFTKIIHYNFFAVNCQPRNIDSKELVVGISPDYPPYAFIDNDTIVGFDIDLLRLIAEKLNLKLKLVPMPFHSILVALQLNNIAVAASGLSGSPERAKQMLISIPYFKNDYLCAVSLKQSALNNLDGLKDKKIIINTGYTSENYLNKMNLNTNLLKLKSVSDALLALSLKQGDVFVTSYASLIQFLKTKEAEKFFIFTLPDTNENQEAISFLINKNNLDLLNNINDCINCFLQDGAIRKLIEKWQLV
jgi:ABC-type amino acid transport substrate-binding protein